MQNSHIAHSGLSDNFSFSECKDKRSKLHTLAKKSKPLCIHTLLSYVAKQSAAYNTNDSESKQVTTKIDRVITVKGVLQKIKDNFPNISEIHKQEFMHRSRQFTEEFMNSESSMSINEHVPSLCSDCSASLIEWKYKPKVSLFITMGHIKHLSIPAWFCTVCKKLYYPGKLLAENTHDYSINSPTGVSTNPNNYDLNKNWNMNLI